MTDEERQGYLSRVKYEAGNIALDKQLEKDKDFQMIMSRILEDIDQSDIKSFIITINFNFDKLSDIEHDASQAGIFVRNQAEMHRGYNSEYTQKLGNEAYKETYKEKMEEFFHFTGQEAERLHAYMPRYHSGRSAYLSNCVLAKLTSLGEKLFPEYDWYVI